MILAISGDLWSIVRCVCRTQFNFDKFLSASENDHSIVKVRWFLIRSIEVSSRLRMRIKPRPHQQQCRSNIRLCRNNRSTYSIRQLLLVWTALKVIASSFLWITLSRHRRRRCCTVSCMGSLRHSCRMTSTDIASPWSAGETVRGYCQRANLSQPLASWTTRRTFPSTIRKPFKREVDPARRRAWWAVVSFPSLATCPKKRLLRLLMTRSVSDSSPYARLSQYTDTVMLPDPKCMTLTPHVEGFQTLGGGGRY